MLSPQNSPLRLTRMSGCTARVGREGLLCLRREAWPRSWRASDGPEKYLVQARVVAVEAERRERILRLRLERRNRDDRPELWRLGMRTHSQQNAICSPSPS